MGNQSTRPSAGPDFPGRLQTSGILFALLATIVWSANFVVGRGLAEAVPPFTLAFGRWLTAFCAVLPFALPSLRREWPHFIRHWKYYCLISLIGIAFFNTAIYVGAHSVPALNMSLIASSSPLFTLILSRFLFGEAVTRARLAGIVIVLCGILLLMSQGELSKLASLSFGAGDLLLLAAAFSFAVYTLLLRKQPPGCSQSAFFAVTFGLGLLMLLPPALWETTHGSGVHFTVDIAGAFLYLGLGASLFSFWCWSRAVRAIGPSKAAIVYYSLPMFSGVGAVLFLGEPIHPVHFISGVFILGGLVLATREQKRDRKPD